jgi:hypothetical protein
VPDVVYRLDLQQGVLAERRRTPQGGLVARANLTRTGVFSYRMPDGSTRRELRHPDEVFEKDSLATYPHAPLTIDHPGRVTPDNWKEHTVGHVAESKREGDFVAGDVHVQDGNAIEQADAGKLREVSCGYQCEIDPTPGDYKGDGYDVVQRKIRINHVALGPAGWGRMGPEVRLHLDSNCAVSGEADPAGYVRGMTEEEKRALEKATADAKTANDLLTKAKQDAADAKTEAEKIAAQARTDAAELVKLKAENEVLRLQVKRITEDTSSAEAKKKLDAQVEETISVRSDARRIFATQDDPTGKAWKHDGKTNAGIKREVIGKLEPDMKTDGLDGAALDAVYLLAMTHRDRVDQANGQLRRTLTADKLDEHGKPVHSDKTSDDEPDAEAEKKKMDERKRDAWKKTPPRSDRRRDRKAAV